jgi:hypothetical protein
MRTAQVTIGMAVEMMDEREELVALMAMEAVAKTACGWEMLIQNVM